MDSTLDKRIAAMRGSLMDTALEDPETNQGHVLRAAWALAEPGDPAHDEAGWREAGGDFHRTTRMLDVGSIGGHRFVHRPPDPDWAA